MRCASPASASRTLVPSALARNGTRVLDLRVEHANSRSGKERLTGSVPIDAKYAAGHVYLDRRFRCAATYRRGRAGRCPGAACIRHADAAFEMTNVQTMGIDRNGYVHVYMRHLLAGRGQILASSRAQKSRRAGCPSLRTLHPRTAARDLQYRDAQIQADFVRLALLQNVGDNNSAQRFDTEYSPSPASLR